jgi:L-arabinose isomerase
LLDTIIYGGYEHHMVMAYGSHSASLTTWANMVGIECIKL